MSLPTSRDFDVSDGDPIPHTLINNLQDAIIGGTHGEINVWHSVRHLQGPRDAAAAQYWNQISLGSLTLSGGDFVNSGFLASFPVGTVLRRARVYMNTGSFSAGKTMTLRLYSYPLGSGSPTYISSWGSDTSESTISTDDVLDISGPDQNILAGGPGFYARCDADQGNVLFGILWTIAKPS